MLGGNRNLHCFVSGASKLTARFVSTPTEPHQVTAPLGLQQLVVSSNT